MSAQMDRSGRARLGAAIGTIALACAAIGTPADARGPIAFVRADGAPAFTLTAIHGAIDVDAAHGLGGGAFWVTGGTITEDNGLVNDGLVIDGTAQHVIPPHGEGPNPNIFLYNFNIDADDWATGANAAAPVVAIFAHGGHFDHYIATLSFTIATVLTVDDITAYTHVVGGRHTDSPGQYRSGHASLDGRQEVPAVDSPAIGSAVIFFDPVTRSIDVSVAVEGVSLSRLTGAHIHRAPPGTSGPVIFDLNYRAFQDAGGTGVVRIIQGGTFPAEHVQALLDGNTYINIHTTQHTGGEIRGQIVMNPPPCAADCNGDGAVDIRDFFGFVQAFSGGVPTFPCPDCNADGSISVADFFCFAAAFSRGCD